MPRSTPVSRGRAATRAVSLSSRPKRQYAMSRDVARQRAQSTSTSSPAKRPQRSTSSVALRHVPAASTPVASGRGRRRAVSVAAAAEMLFDDETEGDQSFDLDSASEDDESDIDSDNSESSDSEVSLPSTPRRQSRGAATPRMARQSHGEPSSKNNSLAIEPTRKRGRPCLNTSLSARKSPGKFLSPGQAAVASGSKVSRSGRPASPRLSDTEGSDFQRKVSGYTPVLSTLPGLEQYASYPSQPLCELTIRRADHVADSLERVVAKLPERESLIHRLATMIGKPDAIPPSCVYIVGHTACGKTSVVKNVLQAVDAFHVWVDGKECYSQDVLFHLILSRLGGSATSSHGGDDNEQFVRQLETQLNASGHKRMILVVDNVHHFLRFPSIGPIPLLHRLYSLISCKIGVVLISSLPWEDLWPFTQSTVPLQIRVPNYSQEELVSILSRDCPVKEQAGAFNTFVQLFCSCSKLSCVNLRHLRYLIRTLYPIYYQPVLSGEVDANEKHELWRRLLPVQRRIVNNFFQHSSRSETTSDGAKHPLAAVDLPYYAKYLVIAGYLASHNPSTLDTQLFTKLGDRLSKRQRHAAKKPGKKAVDYQREGPKVFPLHRLMAIFFSIMEQQAPPSAHLFSQVASLVSLRIFSQENEASRALDDPHYMCLVSEDVALGCAQSVDFDLGAVQASV